MTRAIKRGGKVWINIFPDKPVTKKPAETRMGSGKGNPEFWVAVVKPGRVLFELSFPNEEQARVALNKAIQKLPIKARVITREEALLMAKPTAELAESSTSATLVDELRATKQEALNLRFRNATGQLDNTAEIRSGAPADRPHQHVHPPARDRCRRGWEVSTCLTRVAKPPIADARADGTNAQGPRGPRRVRQDGQDRRRRRHRARPPRRSTASSCCGPRSSTPTTRPTTPTSATRSGSWRPARCQQEQALAGHRSAVRASEK